LCDEKTQDGSVVNEDWWIPTPLISSEEAWMRTIVLMLPSTPDAPKQCRANEVWRKFSQGVFDKYYLYIPSIVDQNCQVLGDSWRSIVAECLERNGHLVSDNVRAEIDGLLNQACARPVTAADLTAEYKYCDTNLIFLTFAFVESAIRFADWLEEQKPEV
jgi:hypothetical protein